MESLSLSFRVVLPLFVWMALGYGLRRLLNLDGGWVNKTNQLVFRLLLPLLLFRNMAESDFRAELAAGFPQLAVYILAALAFSYLVLMLLVPRLEPLNPRRGVIVQGIFRSNTALYGIPVAVAIFGQQGLGVISMLVALVVPFYNVASVYALERYGGGTPNWWGIVKKIITNPLIIAIVLGLLWSLSGLTMWEPIQKPLYSLADGATPLSFLVLGASFSFQTAARNRKTLGAVVLAKLVLMPLVWLGLGVLLGFRGVQLAGILIIFAPPTAISSFPMAVAMGGDPDLSCEIVVFTSALSILSMFGWVFLLQSFALL